jgi:hypothetical protein
LEHYDTVSAHGLSNDKDCRQFTWQAVNGTKKKMTKIHWCGFVQATHGAVAGGDLLMTAVNT